MLTTDSLNRLRRDASIVTVVERFIKLKRQGNNYSACCPFHNEKSPSFSVNAVQNFFKCFGCGRGGDAVSFVRQHEKLDFPEAAEVVAEICGIQLERDNGFDNEAYQQKKVERKGLQQLMDECAAKFTTALWQPGNPGMKYLTEERGYDEATIHYWNIGFAGDDNGIVRHYFSAGALPQLLQLSLITEKEHGHYDFFQNRVLFPIINERGETVSFGGRVLGNGKPKYLNTATTELYDKSRTLYGLYQGAAGIKALGFAILCEGYTDTISLHRAGLTNAVAPCGTGLSPEQCQLLKRHTDRIMLMRDGDEAGIKATARDLPLLLRYGFAVDVMPLEDRKDADDLAKEFITVGSQPSCHSQNN